MMIIITVLKKIGCNQMTFVVIMNHCEVVVSRGWKECLGMFDSFQ